MRGKGEPCQGIREDWDSAAVVKEGKCQSEQPERVNRLNCGTRPVLDSPQDRQDTGGGQDMASQVRFKKIVNCNNKGIRTVLPYIHPGSSVKQKGKWLGSSDR